jgi:5-methylcytosine-specific restriction endonuclease McrA
MCICKRCIKEAARLWSKNNRDKANAQGRKWAHANPEKVKAKNRLWGEANRDKRAASSRKWAKNHPEETAARRLAWARAHPEVNVARVAAWRIANPEKAKTQRRNYKARRNLAPGVLTAADTQAQYNRQKGKCFYCDAKVGDIYHVDHVVPFALGGLNIPENIVIACPACNLKKGAKHPMDFAGVML